MKDGFDNWLGLFCVPGTTRDEMQLVYSLVCFHRYEQNGDTEDALEAVSHFRQALRRA